MAEGVAMVVDERHEVVVRVDANPKQVQCDASVHAAPWHEQRCDAFQHTMLAFVNGS